VRIGIIGAGNIGGNLGLLLAKKGHDIRFGVRNPEAEKDLAARAGGRTAAVDVRTAAAFAEVVMLAVPWEAVPSVLDQTGDLSGKVLIDCTNPIRWENGPVVAIEGSGAQEIAKRAPGAKVVKAFNTLGAEHLQAPKFGAYKADVYIAADDQVARNVAASLARELGFDVVDVGPLRNARLLEHLAVLWVHLATQGGLGRSIAFKVIKK
jgi:NADPH-dependent F420 reductase